MGTITTHQTSRRDLLAGSVALPFVLAGAGRAGPAYAQDKGQPQQQPVELPFDANVVRRTARTLAEKPFQQPDTSLPPSLTDLDYDKYRTIRFKPDRALWRGEGLPFEAQFFHRGFLFTDRVAIHEVRDGKARPILYSPDLFDFGAVPPPPSDARVGFAGFRLHTPINRPDYYDEVAVFLGASYFRAVAKGQTYGLSARGLSIATADPRGEEFPAFRAFWIEKPPPHTGSIVVHALLDSKSAAAAYRFTIRPGETTVFDVEMTLYPRTDLDLPGIGTCTSMFFFGPNDRVGVDDFRPAVHDSDGLAIRNGRGEEIWRPLHNPADLQISIFEDTNPRGFGLLQRARDFRAYEDLESRFETRPSLWVEPIGDWGTGATQLVEIPTREEIHDNIVAFWRPKDRLSAKGEYWFTYRLHWGAGKPGTPPLAVFARTRAGAGPDGTRRFVLDITGDALKRLDPAAVRGLVETDKGRILNVVTQPNPVEGGWRMSFELAPERETVVELRALLMRGEERLTETWLYRWTA
ncbi:glucan biosynthesis protein G [Rhodoplanes sp. TEM]|uniref:Glucans biosynthesis protein G n=1 Tax=Rhodoplanes tepidamans TaxID=200616 RepID=A0ABT5J394_RHOTP|nr:MULTISPECIES: glucan biosynthesis protein G [Rhodoplanes]MDC7784135.1 glucan biosynthesis protein G [Rhodoplanes tepidamans]MDC7983230.1 glucan biosynthesis protein G [Rhodoplanes sp. TEM]MDQ0356767.1 glucans biosynthesis protein [Rhodoplanes tepidamans]